MRRRKRIATIVMLLGLVGSGAILGVGRFKYAWATHRLATLQAECSSAPRGPTRAPAATSLVKPGETLGPAPDKAQLPPGYTEEPIPHRPPAVLHDRDFAPDPLANAVPLRDICDSSTSIGFEIAEQSDAREKAWNTTWDSAWFLALLLSLPRAWYFLLDRIGELAESIRGDRGSA